MTNHNESNGLAGRLIFKKMWGWIALGVSAISNLLDMHFPLQVFSWKSSLFFLLVMGLLFFAELVLWARREGKANQVGGAGLVWMWITAIWTMLFAPLLPP